MITEEYLGTIEQNHLGHFEFLPKELGFDMHEIDGVSIINCGLGSSMFNIVYGVPIKDYDLEDIIAKIKDIFAGQPFAWWVPPRFTNPKLRETLLKAGLIIETIEHAMICNLADISSLEKQTDLIIKPVIDNILLQDFIHVLEPYDNAVRTFYERMNNNHFNLNEKLFVGYVNNQPITIAILFAFGDSAGIFSLLTDDKAQGKGYGTDMMRYLLRTAKENSCKFVTLSASSDSGYRIYERLGFHKIGEFECFEYKGEVS